MEQLQEIPPDTQELVKFSETSAALARFEERATGLKIDGVKDRKGLLAVREVRKDIKAERVAVTKYASEIKASAIAFQRRVNTELRPITTKFLSLEKPLWEMERAIQKEKDKIKEANIQSRIDELGQYGQPFDYQIVKKMSKAAYKCFLKECKAAHFLAEEKRKAADLVLQQQQDAKLLEEPSQNISTSVEEKRPLEQISLFPDPEILTPAGGMLDEHGEEVILDNSVFNKEKINDRISELNGIIEFRKILTNIQLIDIPEFKNKQLNDISLILKTGLDNVVGVISNRLDKIEKPDSNG